MNLIEGLHEELTRNRELLKLYQEIPQGVFGATMIAHAISAGELLESVDVPEELK